MDKPLLKEIFVEFLGWWEPTHEIGHEEPSPLFSLRVMTVPGLIAKLTVDLIA